MAVNVRSDEDIQKDVLEISRGFIKRSGEYLS